MGISNSNHAKSVGRFFEACATQLEASLFIKASISEKERKKKAQAVFFPMGAKFGSIYADNPEPNSFKSEII